MRYLLPAIVFVAFAALIVLSPHIEPRRLRARALLVDGRLRAEHGFITGSKASWAETKATGWPPFHYGKHRETDGELLGTIDGYPVRVAGYECVNAGARHRYGLACVVLPNTVDWAEVRGEPVFSSARVPEHVPDGRQPAALPDFDKAYQIYAEESEPTALVRSRALASAMLQVPEQFNWRCLDSEVLLWRRDGWPSADALITAVHTVLQILDPLLLADL
jgi:hypothetical protein